MIQLFLCDLTLFDCCQYHRRLFVLDMQLVHMNMVNFYSLGKWWFRKMSRAMEKHLKAQEELNSCGVDIKVLRTEWATQLRDVTEAAPCKAVHITLKYLT